MSENSSKLHHFVRAENHIKFFYEEANLIYHICLL